MKKTGKTLLWLLSLLLLIGLFPLVLSAEEEEGRIRILYTGDIHSAFDEVGKLKTLIDGMRDENTLYLDAGDYAMGTLLQAGFSTDACELRLLGMLGCDAVTVGNHEWDYGAYGFADQMNAAASAAKQGEKLPKFVQANLDFSGELTEEQKAVQTALANYGASEYAVFTLSGKKIGVFGLLGPDAEEDSPTSGMKFSDYCEKAKETVKTLREKESVDCIVCLSHSGTSADGKTGEDYDLVSAVPGIDVIISGHSHNAFFEAVTFRDTVIVSPGSNMDYLGKLDLSVGKDGVSLLGNELIPVDSTAGSDREIGEKLASFKERIGNTYLSAYGVTPDQVIAYSPFAFQPLEEMYATHGEYPMGNLIADSYFYEAEQNGIDDLDVALVALGTIRGSFPEGAITVADCFEICSLGVDSDGTAGHPILVGYFSGKDLKLLCELDASLGPLVSSIKMSYAGLRMTFNEKRIPLDRLTEVRLVRKDGSEEEIEDDKLYHVAANAYAANMLGMVNDLTKGILKIVVRDRDGNPVESLSSCAMTGKDGQEVREWIAFMDYLSSFDKEKNGISLIPEEKYGAPVGRKVKVSEGGFAVIKNPGAATWIAGGLLPVILALVILAVFLIRKGIRTKRRKKAERTANQ